MSSADMPSADLGQPDLAATDMSSAPDMAPAAPLFVLVGSGAYGGSIVPGRITRYAFNPLTGSLTQGRHTPSGRLPSYMALNQDARWLHVSDERDGALTTYALDADAQLTRLGELRLANASPVHLSLTGQRRQLLISHYTQGAVESVRLSASGTPEASVARVSSGPKTHAALPSPDGRYAFAVSLEGDRVMQYILSTDGQLSPNPSPSITLPSGAGPRHLTFHPHGRWAYLVQELVPALVRLDYDATQGTLTIAQTVALYPAGVPDRATGAAIHVHPSGRWLMATTRPRGRQGELFIAPLNAQGVIGAPTSHSTRGQTPRSMAISPDGRHLVIGNQDSGTLSTFAFDPLTGALTPLDRREHAAPFFVTFAQGR